MLRSRAIKLPEITESMWEQVDEEHRSLVQEFLDAHSFRDKTRKQYYSSLRQFFWWVHTSLNGKKLYKISKRDFIRYQSFLKNRGMSSSGIALKKAGVSSLITLKMLLQKMMRIMRNSETSHVDSRLFQKPQHMKK